MRWTTLAYTITDEAGNTDTASIAVTVTSVLDAPIAVDDAASTDEDTATSISSVLANDSDVDSETLSVSAIDTSATLGLVTDTGDGTFAYDPNGAFEALGAGDTATDSFTYTVEDETGEASQATVTIEITGVDDAPTATDDTVTLNEDGSVDIDVLANDVDPEDGILTITADEDPNGGTVEVINGLLRYTPAADFNGATTIGYTITDEAGNTDTASIAVTVTSVLDAPNALVASGDGFTTDEDSVFTTANVLDNDSDGDDDTLRVAAVSLLGTLGDVTDNGDGTFTYDPGDIFQRLGSGESAIDSFTYTLVDDSGDETEGTVSIEIFGVDNDGLGSDLDDILVGSDADADLDAQGGNDTVAPGSGIEQITLGTGLDRVIGTSDDLFGDTLTDFLSEDEIVFEGVAFASEDLSLLSDPQSLTVDTDQDGTSNGSLSLIGDYSSGAFMAIVYGSDTTVTFESLLPDLVEKQDVGNTNINGIINQNFLRGDGDTTFTVSLDSAGYGGFENVLGVYEITEGGDITDVQILVANVKEDNETVVAISDVDEGNTLGFFIVQDAADWAENFTDADSFVFVNTDGDLANITDGADTYLTVNGATTSETVFHSYASDLNSDGIQHALSGTLADGNTLEIGFEDITGGGDQDYQDVLFSVDRLDM